MMSDIEAQVQQHLTSFIKFLPSFVEKWKELLEEVKRPVEGMVNQAEQMRAVESVTMEDMDDFKEMQQRLLFKIYEGIEYEIAIVKDVVNKLNKLNNDFKNKLMLLENASVNLDWGDEASALIRGGPTQPAMDLILDYALDFWLFFRSATNSINSSLRTMNAREVKSMNELENSFNIDLDSPWVRRLLAITQYIDNNKAIV